MTTIEKHEGGVKDDAKKVQLELLSPQWLHGVGEVLTFGARKYAAHNWRKGLARTRLLGACLRHVMAYLGGEDTDPETGLLHLDHASCCLMFASELHRTRPDTDDRYRGEPNRIDLKNPANRIDLKKPPNLIGLDNISWYRCSYCGEVFIPLQRVNAGYICQHCGKAT